MELRWIVYLYSEKQVIEKDTEYSNLIIALRLEDWNCFPSIPEDVNDSKLSCNSTQNNSDYSKFLSSFQVIHILYSSYLPRYPLHLRMHLWCQLTNLA